LTLGCALAALSARLEPMIGKEYLHGSVFGFLLMFLASPLLFFARLPTRLAMRVALLALVLWTVAFATVLVLFFPLQTVGIWLISVSESDRPLAIALAFVLVAFGIHVLISGAVQSILDYVVATFFVLRAGPRRDVARAFAIGVVPAVVIAAVAASQGAVAWSSPPLTFDARLSGSIIIAGAFVAAVAYAKTAPPEARDDPFAARRQPPYAYIAAAGIAWLLIAPLVAPNGFAPPRLAIYAAPAYASLAHDGITEHALAETEARMGLSAASDRILVLYRESDGTRFTSHHAFLPDSNILVSIDGNADDARRRYVLHFQIGNGMLGNAIDDLPGPLRVGYSYWAARDLRSPFETGIQSGGSPHAACGDLAETDLGTLADEAITLDSVPFVVAERESGVLAAQALFRSLTAVPFDVAEWTDRVTRACAVFLSRYADPPLPVFRIVPTALTFTFDDGIAQIVASLEARTHLTGRGRTVVVRYEPSLPDGRQSISEFPDPGTVLVRVSSALPQSVRRANIAIQIAAAFIVIKYGNGYDTLRAGFASWASRDETNPFLAAGTAPMSSASVCAGRARYPLDGNTAGAGWLSSLPFVLAERDGGESAAQQLLRDIAEIGGRLDMNAWTKRVDDGCAVLLRPS
jgi:hypothetical protein